MTDEELRAEAWRLVLAWETGDSGLPAERPLEGDDPYAAAIVALAKRYAEAVKTRERAVLLDALSKAEITMVAFVVEDHPHLRAVRAALAASGAGEPK